MTVVTDLGLGRGERVRVKDWGEVMTPKELNIPPSIKVVMTRFEVVMLGEEGG